MNNKSTFANRYISAALTIAKVATFAIVLLTTGFSVAMHNRPAPLAMDAIRADKALLAAVARGDVAYVENWLQGGGDPNYDKCGGKTLLWHAVGAGQGCMVDFLLRVGANPACKDDLDVTPLHLAVQDGRTDLVRMLLATGQVGLNCRGGVLRATPLHFAAAQGNEEVIHELLCAGADVACVDVSGQTARDVAVAARAYLGCYPPNHRKNMVYDGVIRELSA